MSASKKSFTDNVMKSIIYWDASYAIAFCEIDNNPGFWYNKIQEFLAFYARICGLQKRERRN